MRSPMAPSKAVARTDHNVGPLPRWLGHAVQAVLSIAKRFRQTHAWTAEWKLGFVMHVLALRRLCLLGPCEAESRNLATS